MFIKIGDNYADQELNYLKELLCVIDEKLAWLKARIEDSRDPESDGYCDKAEYFSGVGFVAIQQYFENTRSMLKIEKHKAYSSGVEFDGINQEVSYAYAVNAVANYWKHSPEWFNYHLKEKVLGRDQMLSIERLKNISDCENYPISDALYNLTNGGLLSDLMPFVQNWRESVDNLNSQLMLKEWME